MEQLAQVEALRAEGLTWRAIADRIGRKHEVVYKTWRRAHPDVEVRVRRQPWREQYEPLLAAELGQEAAQQALDTIEKLGLRVRK